MLQVKPFSWSALIDQWVCENSASFCKMQNAFFLLFNTSWLHQAHLQILSFSYLFFHSRLFPVSHNSHYQLTLSLIVLFPQAIIMMLEDGHERVMTLMKNLLQFFSKTNIVKPDQIKSVSFDSLKENAGVGDWKLTNRIILFFEVTFCL